MILGSIYVETKVVSNRIELLNDIPENGVMHKWSWSLGCSCDCDTLQENIKTSLENMSALHLLSFYNLTWSLTASEER